MRGDLVAADLRIPIDQPTEAVLDLTVEDGDNPPLDLKEVTAVLAELPWIYFESADGSPLVARYGQPSLARPAYDLEARRASLATVTPRPAAWGDPRALEPETAPPAASEVGEHAGATIDLAPFRFERGIPPGSGTLVAVPLDAAVLAHSAGSLGGRFADLRIVDDRDRQVPYLLERLDEPFVTSLPLPARLADRSVPAPPGRALSRYRLQLPYPKLPEGTLVLETTARAFERTVRVSIEHAPDARHRDPWMESISEADWRHVDPDTPAPRLGLRIPTVDTTDLLVTVDEGDNSPLPIASASLLLPSVRIRFFRPPGVALRMVYGQQGLAPPRYDLALLAGTVLGSAATEVTPSAERSIEPPAPSVLVSPPVFWGVLILAVVVLLGLVVRLMRTGTEDRA